MLSLRSILSRQNKPFKRDKLLRKLSVTGEELKFKISQQLNIIRNSAANFRQ
jgi:hypothetical protein